VHVDVLEGRDRGFEIAACLVLGSEQQRLSRDQVLFGLTMCWMRTCRSRIVSTSSWNSRSNTASAWRASESTRVSRALSMLASSAAR
jgi:hypothetical protein